LPPASTWYRRRVDAPAIRYYPSVEQQTALLRRYLRGRMYAFIGMVAGCAVFDGLAAWWVVNAL
jgi:hypothetical protein